MTDASSRVDFSSPAAARDSLERLTDEGMQLSHLVEEAADLYAVASVTLEKAQADANLQCAGAKPAAMLKAQALPLYADQLEAYERAKARLDAVKARLRWLSSAVSAAQTANSLFRLEMELSQGGIPEHHNQRDEWSGDPGPKEPRR